MDGSLATLLQQLFRELRDHATQMEQKMYGRLQLLESRMERAVCQCEEQYFHSQGDKHIVRPVFEQVSVTRAPQEEPVLAMPAKENSAAVKLGQNGSPQKVSYISGSASPENVRFLPKADLTAFEKPFELASSENGENQGRVDVRRTETSRRTGRRTTGLLRTAAPSKSGTCDLTYSQQLKSRSPLHRAVINPKFDHLCVIVVLVNSLLVGLTIDHEAGSDSEPLKGIYMVLEYVCTAFFSVELLLRIVVYGCRFFKGKSGNWAIFDCVLVAVSWADVALEVIFGDTEAMPGPGASMGKMLKMMRMARIMRILRMVRFLTKIRIMAKMIAGSMVSLFWLLILLLAVMYIFAIVLTQGATMWLKPGGSDVPPTQDADYTPAQDFFGGVPRTTYTLFSSITGGLSWMEAANVSQALGSVYFFVFLFFIFFSIFSVMNIVTGVFVDGAIQQANKDRSMKEQKLAEARAEIAEDLQELLTQIDKDCTGSLSRADMVAALSDVKMQRSLEAMGIDVHDADDLWLFLDSGEDGLVDIQAFVQGMMRIKGQAKSIDIHILLVKVNKLLDGFDEMKEKLSQSSRVSRVSGSAASMTNAKPVSSRNTSRINYLGSVAHSKSGNRRVSPKPITR